MSAKRMSILLRMFAGIFVGLGCMYLGINVSASSLFALATLSGLGAIDYAILSSKT